MKKLFCVKNKDGKILKNGSAALYFGNKKKAKEQRRLANGRNIAGDEIKVTGYYVGLGPDHRRYSE